MGKYLVVLICLSLVFGLGPTPKTEDVAVYEKFLVIDKFDDADITASPAWWTFDKLDFKFAEATADKYGLYYLKLGGKTTDYYVGGFGTYVGKEADEFDTFMISVFGTGKTSGTVKFEMYDDDNRSYQLEQDNEYQPIYDDKIEYEVVVDWEGWRTIEIPIARFIDVNQGVGDDIWNPDSENNSGGLLHFQIVVNASSKEGAIALAIDNIQLAKTKK